MGEPFAIAHGQEPQVLKTPVQVAFRQASYGRNTLFNKHFRPQDDQPKAMEAGNLLPVVPDG